MRSPNKGNHLELIQAEHNVGSSSNNPSNGEKAARQACLEKAEKRFALLRKGQCDSEGAKSKKSDRIVTTLLYVTFVLNRVEDLKGALRTDDRKSYETWEELFTSLHSPEFHISERKLQNTRVKQLLKRKNFFKTELEEAKMKFKSQREDLENQKSNADKLAKEMSETISRLSNEIISKQEIISTFTDQDKILADTRHQCKLQDKELSELDIKVKHFSEENKGLHLELESAKKQIDADEFEIKALKKYQCQSQSRVENLEEIIESDKLKWFNQFLINAAKAEENYGVTEKNLKGIIDKLVKIESDINASEETANQLRLKDITIKDLECNVSANESEINEIRKCNSSLEEKVLIQKDKLEVLAGNESSELKKVKEIIKELREERQKLVLDNERLGNQISKLNENLSESNKSLIKREEALQEAETERKFETSTLHTLIQDLKDQNLKLSKDLHSSNQKLNDSELECKRLQRIHSEMKDDQRTSSDLINELKSQLEDVRCDAITTTKNETLLKDSIDDSEHTTTLNDPVEITRYIEDRGQSLFDNTIESNEENANPEPSEDYKEDDKSLTDAKDDLEMNNESVDSTKLSAVESVTDEKNQDLSHAEPFEDSKQDDE